MGNTQEYSIGFETIRLKAPKFKLLTGILIFDLLAVLGVFFPDDGVIDSEDLEILPFIAITMFVILFVLYKRFKKYNRVKRLFIKYRIVQKTNKITYIRDIAKGLGITPMEVIKDFEELIKYGELKRYHLDYGEMALVLTDFDGNYTEVMNRNLTKVRCSNCGDISHVIVEDGVFCKNCNTLFTLDDVI